MIREGVFKSIDYLVISFSLYFSKTNNPLKKKTVLRRAPMRINRACVLSNIPKRL